MLDAEGRACIQHAIPRHITLFYTIHVMYTRLREAMLSARLHYILIINIININNYIYIYMVDVYIHA